MGMVVVSGLSYFMVIRHLNSLLTPRRELGRAILTHAPVWMNETARSDCWVSAFDQMAASLQERENERKVSHESYNGRNTSPTRLLIVCPVFSICSINKASC